MDTRRDSPERARIWRHAALKGTELFHGSYRKHQFGRHFHPIPAISIVESGIMRVHFSQATHVLGSGSIFLLNPGDIHAPGPAGPHGWSFRVFYIENFLPADKSDEFGGDALRFRTQIMHDPALALALLRLHQQLESYGTALEAESTLLTIFARLVHKHTGSSNSLRIGTELARISRAREYLAAHYHRNVTLDELAGVAEFSPYHFLRVFRNAIGLTPHVYLTQIRIEAAKRLLQTGRSIASTAYETGFVDQSHFTRQFKRLLGVTPGQYLPNQAAELV